MVTSHQIATAIRRHIEGEPAERMILKYYRPGKYTGARFDQPPFVGTPPNQFVYVDLLAPATLSAELKGRSVTAILDQADDLSGLLEALPDPEVHLVDTTDADLEPLWELQNFLDSRKVPGVSQTRMTKLIAQKRPLLMPIRDRFVNQALGIVRDDPLTVHLRDALREIPDLITRLEHLAGLVADAGGPTIGYLRALDVVLWMAAWGDRQVPD